MIELKNTQVLVIGLGARGRAACELLRRRGAEVVGVDSADTPDLRAHGEKLHALGVKVEWGAKAPPSRDFGLAVLSPEMPASTELVREVVRRGVRLIGELELGFQLANCLTIAISGTNGKGTTAELVERILVSDHRTAILSGHGAQPICAVVDQTKNADFLVLKVNALQLEATEFFRPSVAVLMNLAADHLDHYADPGDYIRASARLFRNQQAFDWAVIQSEALAKLRTLDLPIPAKTITFSATDHEADLYLDRSLLISRLANWTGPLLDMAHVRLRGPHNAENLMAALAVGHVLRLPLDRMLEAAKTYPGAPHRFELVDEIAGVQFINDSRATNLDALQKALQTVRPGLEGRPNVWLIAGGRENGLEFHDLGPLLTKHVKQAFLIGEASEKIRAAWGLFTPCTVAKSLLEAVAEAARNAASGDVVLLSPACSSFDQFRNYQHRGDIFCQAVRSMRRGDKTSDPNLHGERVTD